MTEKIMTDKGIDYEPIIMTDEVVSDLKALGYMSAPVVLVGDHEVFGWAGFQPALINELVEQIKQSQAAT